MPIFALAIGQYTSNMKKTQTKSFKDWQYEEVENTFGLTRLRTLPFIEEAQKMTLPSDYIERERLEMYRLELFDSVDTWNEDEYKFMFIGPYFKLINFTTPYFRHLWKYCG